MFLDNGDALVIFLLTLVGLILPLEKKPPMLRRTQWVKRNMFLHAKHMNRHFLRRKSGALPTKLHTLK
jgi:hypothetical protein